MDEAVVSNTIPELPTDAQHIIEEHLQNLRNLLEQMSHDQKEIDLLRTASQATMRETDRILSETRKVLTNIGAS
jgi:hypothetical protein